MIVNQQHLFAKDVKRLLDYADSLGLIYTLGEAFRTKEQALWNFKNKTGIKDSLHCKRLAIDIHLFSDKYEYLIKNEFYEPLGIKWEQLDPANRWGGRFNNCDGNHFERRESGYTDGNSSQ